MSWKLGGYSRKDEADLDVRLGAIQMPADGVFSRAFMLLATQNTEIGTPEKAGLGIPLKIISLTAASARYLTK